MIDKCNVCGQYKEVISLDRKLGYKTIKNENSIEVCKDCFDSTVKDGFLITNFSF